VERSETWWKADEGAARQLEKVGTREGKRQEGKNMKVVEGVLKDLREHLKIEG
jgi:hypothetical protein